MPLGTRFHTVDVVDETGSTNADLMARAQSASTEFGEIVGSVLIARHQTAGRGRQGRTWFDHPDAALLMSVALSVEADKAGLIPLVTGTAVVEALGRLEVDVALKWPNDVLVPHRNEPKVAGILAEAMTTPEGLLAVVGIGLNVDFGGSLPADVLEGAIDLATITGSRIGPDDRSALVVEILTALDRELAILETEGPGAALDRYRPRCLTLGRAVRFEMPAGVIEGRAVDLDPSGGLVIEGADGARTTVTAGDAHHL